MIAIKTFVFNPFDENTYLVWDTDTKQAMVIDPGMYNAHERATFDRFIKENGLTLVHMVNTHLHLDHTWGNDHVADTYKLKTEANSADSMLGARRREQAQMFGMNPDEMRPLNVETDLTQGDIITVGRIKFEVIQVPGHSPGGIALYDKEAGVVFSGDSLFERSIGRTDLPGGNYAQLVNAVTRRLLSLPGNTVVYPGHGNPTTVAAELASNPYL